MTCRGEFGSAGHGCPRGCGAGVPGVFHTGAEARAGGVPEGGRVLRARRGARCLPCGGTRGRARGGTRGSATSRGSAGPGSGVGPRGGLRLRLWLWLPSRFVRGEGDVRGRSWAAPLPCRCGAGALGPWASHGHAVRGPGCAVKGSRRRGVRRAGAARGQPGAGRTRAAAGCLPAPIRGGCRAGRSHVVAAGPGGGGGGRWRGGRARVPLRAGRGGSGVRPAHVPLRAGRGVLGCGRRMCRCGPGGGFWGAAGACAAAGRARSGSALRGPVTSCRGVSPTVRVLPAPCGRCPEHRLRVAGTYGSRPYEGVRGVRRTAPRAGWRAGP